MSIINLKVTIIGVAVASYFAYSTLSKRQEAFNEQISKISKNIPSQLKVSKEGGETGLFSSKGVYKLSFNNPIEKKNNVALVLNIEAEHGLSSLFSGEVLLKGTTKIEGGIINALKIKTSDGLLSKLEGSIDANGNISLKESGSGIDLALPVNGQNVKFKVKPFTGEIKYLSATGEINKTISIPEIKGSNEFDSNITYTLKNTAVKYSSNINKLQHNKLNIKVALLDVPSEKLKVEGVTINNSIEEKPKKQVIKIDSNLTKLNSKSKSKSNQDATLYYLLRLP